MWSFNIARSLAREAGLKLAPDRVPKSDPEMLSASESYLKSRPTGTRCIIKTHIVIAASPSVKVIRNQRNLKDRLYSLSRFMQVNFDEQSIAAAVAKSLNVDSHYDQWPAESILNIPFESIETNSIDLVCQIAEFIGLPDMSAEIFRAVDFRYSKQQVRRQISEVEDRVFDRAGNVRSGADPDAVLDVGTGQIRAFDTASGFQSGHVSDYRAGDWEHLWTDRQKQMVDDAIRDVWNNRNARNR